MDIHAWSRALARLIRGRGGGRPSQFEQEADLGCGGGEVDDETMAEAWREAARRRSTANIREEAPASPDERPQAGRR